MTKRLYLISYNFIPSARADGINRGYLCQALNKNNWDISVVTTANPQRLLMTYQEDETLWSILPDSVKIHRIWAFNPVGLGELLYLSRAFVCPHQYWAETVKRESENIFTKPGILYAVIPPISNALIGLAVKRRYSFPLVLDFRDEYLNVEMIHRYSIERKRFERLERRLVKAADLIITATDGIQSILMERYGFSERQVHVIYNGYGEVPENFEKTCNDDTLRIIYMGTIGRFQQPDVLCRAFRLLMSRHPELIGRLTVDFYGPENYYVKRFLKKELGKGINYYGYLPLMKMLAQLREADVGFTSIAYDALSYMLPSKVFYYIAYEKPVIAAVPQGVLSSLIEKHQIGISMPPFDVEALYHHLYLLIKDPTLIKRMKQNLSKIKAEYSVFTQAQRLSGLLEPIAPI